MSYLKGRRIEYKVRDKLKKLGAEYVIRSAGSKGIVDLIAFFPTMKKVWLIQVKSSKKKISEKSLSKKYARMHDLEGYYHVFPMIALKQNKELKFIPI